MHQSPSSMKLFNAVRLQIVRLPFPKFIEDKVLTGRLGRAYPVIRHSTIHGRELVAAGD